MERSKGSARFVGSIEAMLYAFFFVIALAIVGSLFAVSSRASDDAVRLERAVELASDAAAAFALDPSAEREPAFEGGLTVDCAIEDELKPFGHLYHATIRVLDGDAVVYELKTARYASVREDG